MLARKRTTPTLTQAVSGDVFVPRDDTGHWSLVLYYQRPHARYAHIAIFRDKAGRKYEWPLAKLQRLTLNREKPSAAPESEGDAIDKRLYKTRSRKSARQRDAGKLTPEQHRTIFGLAKGRGMDIDDIRAMTEGGSIRKLTIGEGKQIIDRLMGRGGKVGAP